MHHANFTSSRLAAFGLDGRWLLGCVAPTPVFASAYWTGFKRFWFDYVAQADGVVLVALLVGLASLFIITRGKWLKS